LGYYNVNCAEAAKAFGSSPIDMRWAGLVCLFLLGELVTLAAKPTKGNPSAAAANHA